MARPSVSSLTPTGASCWRIVTGSSARSPTPRMCLLKHILGVGDRAEDPVTMRQQLAPVGVNELTEGLAITGPGPGEGCLSHLGGRPFTWITPPVGATPAAPRIHRRIA